MKGACEGFALESTFEGSPMLEASAVASCYVEFEAWRVEDIIETEASGRIRLLRNRSFTFLKDAAYHRPFTWGA